MKLTRDLVVKLKAGDKLKFIDAKGNPGYQIHIGKIFTYIKIDSSAANDPCIYFGETLGGFYWWRFEVIKQSKIIDVGGNV